MTQPTPGIEPTFEPSRPVVLGDSHVVLPLWFFQQLMEVYYAHTSEPRETPRQPMPADLLGDPLTPPLPAPTIQKPDSTPSPALEGAASLPKGWKPGGLAARKPSGAPI